MLTNEQQMDIIKGALANNYEGSISQLLSMASSQTEVANTPQQQQEGLRNKPPGTTMAFPQVSGDFNTMGMNYPIDVQKYDNTGNLVKSYENVPPGIKNLKMGEGEGTVVETASEYQGGGFDQDPGFRETPEYYDEGSPLTHPQSMSYRASQDWSKVKPILDEHNLTMEYARKYALSDNFKNLLKKQGYNDEEIVTRQNAILNFDSSKQVQFNPFIGNSWVQPGDPNLVTYGMYDRGASWKKGDTDWYWPNVVEHEIGHLGYGTGTSSQSIPLKTGEYGEISQRIKESGVSRESYGDTRHDISPYERRADLFQLRMQLMKSNIYDSSKGGEFTKEHLKEFKKTDEYNRIYRLHDDDNIIWMMNNIAEGKEHVPLRYSGSEYKKVKTGGPRKYQEGGGATWQDVLNTINESNTINDLYRSQTTTTSGMDPTGAGGLGHQATLDIEKKQEENIEFNRQVGNLMQTGLTKDVATNIIRINQNQQTEATLRPTPLGVHPSVDRLYSGSGSATDEQKRHLAKTDANIFNIAATLGGGTISTGPTKFSSIAQATSKSRPLSNISKNNPYKMLKELELQEIMKNRPVLSNLQYRHLEELDDLALYSKGLGIDLGKLSTKTHGKFMPKSLWNKPTTEPWYLGLADDTRFYPHKTTWEFTRHPPIGRPIAAYNFPVDPFKPSYFKRPSTFDHIPIYKNWAKPVYFRGHGIQGSNSKILFQGPRDYQLGGWLLKNLPYGIKNIKKIKPIIKKVFKGSSKGKEKIIKTIPEWSQGVTHHGKTYNPQVLDAALQNMKSTGKYLDDIGYNVNNQLSGKNMVFHGTTKSGQNIVEVALPNGRRQLFYRSTGKGDKFDRYGVSSKDKWYPYGGHGANYNDQRQLVKNWFIKDKGWEDYYGSKTFRNIAGNLDRIGVEEGWNMAKLYKFKKKGGLRKYQDGSFNFSPYTTVSDQTGGLGTGVNIGQNINILQDYNTGQSNLAQNYKNIMPWLANLSNEETLNRVNMISNAPGGGTITPDYNRMIAPSTAGLYSGTGAGGNVFNPQTYQRQKSGSQVIQVADIFSGGMNLVRNIPSLIRGVKNIPSMIQKFKTGIDAIKATKSELKYLNSTKLFNSVVPGGLDTKQINILAKNPNLTNTLVQSAIKNNFRITKYRAVSARSALNNPTARDAMIRAGVDLTNEKQVASWITTRTHTGGKNLSHSQYGDRAGVNISPRGWGDVSYHTTRNNIINPKDFQYQVHKYGPWVNKMRVKGSESLFDFTTGNRADWLQKLYKFELPKYDPSKIYSNIDYPGPYERGVATFGKRGHQMFESFPGGPRYEPRKVWNQGGLRRKYQDGGVNNDAYTNYRDFVMSQEAGDEHMGTIQSVIQKRNEAGNLLFDESNNPVYYSALEDGMYYPYLGSDENQLTIGYGHKGANLENIYPSGLSQTAASTLLDEDIQTKMTSSQDYYDTRFGEGKWGALSDRNKYMLTDIAFNVGDLDSFPKFSEAVYRRDPDRLQTEYLRHTNTGARLARNTPYFNQYVQPYINEINERNRLKEKYTIDFGLGDEYSAKLYPSEWDVNLNPRLPETTSVGPLQSGYLQYATPYEYGENLEDLTYYKKGGRKKFRKRNKY